jgi:hypothetical protein
MILQISASQVVRITGTSHWRLIFISLVYIFKKKFWKKEVPLHGLTMLCKTEDLKDSLLF